MNYYLLQLLKLCYGRHFVTVADVGSGPHALRKCRFVNGLEIEFTPIDKQDFFRVEKQDMENLPYKDDSFDGAQCINALDHTKNAEKALKEMIRVAKNWVYIDCNLDQKSTSGGHHYWDAKEDGTFTNGKDSFSLKDYGFEIEYINNGGERRYNHVIGSYSK